MIPLKKRLQTDLRFAKTEAAHLDEVADKGGDRIRTATQARSSAAIYQQDADRLLSILLNTCEGDLS